MYVHPRVMTRLKLDQWGSRWSFARGATKASHRTKGQSMTELTDALAEVDGLLAGINYLERVEPDSDETNSSFAQKENAEIMLPTNSTTGSWLGHLTINLPQVNNSESQERSNIEIKRLRNILDEKLRDSNGNSRSMPQESQWATLRSLRKASEFYYNQFTRATADSASADIRKLRKSYVTAKNMLEMGILTFRDVLHGHNPTTLVDIFAFASLSYVISKTLHAKGHIEESEILSGILDWRAAIVDDRERSAFDEVARRLWPEAKEIMHFFAIERYELDSTGLRRVETELRRTSPIIPQQESSTLSSERDHEHTKLGEDSLSFTRDHDYPPIYQEDTTRTSYFTDFQHLPDGLEDCAYQIIQETMWHDDFMFSSWLNFDHNTRDDYFDPSFQQGTAATINLNVIDQSKTEFSTGTESAPSKSSDSPPDDFEGTPPTESINQAANDTALSHLIENPLFKMVFSYITQKSEMSDLLNVLSGYGLTSRKNCMNSAHPCPPWVAFEFLDQAPKQFFGPLHREAVQIDETFSGIVAMAEMFVRLGSLHTVREVEDYIITVGRYLTRSYDLFKRLVSKTLIQCLIVSQQMKWNLLYPQCATEVDEYSIEYINKRKKSEKNWADSVDVQPNSLEDDTSPTSSTSERTQKYSPNSSKRPCHGNRNSGSKRRRRDILSTSSQDTPSQLDVSIIEYCPVNNCTKSFTGSAAHNNLSRHVQTEHNKKKLKCPNCGHETARRDNLRQHFLKVHTNSELPDWIANKKRGLPS